MFLFQHCFITQFSKTFSLHHMVVTIKTQAEIKTHIQKWRIYVRFVARPSQEWIALRHIEAVHQNVEVQCEKCFKKFNRKDAMKRHQQKCCICRLCDVDFSNSLELARHHCTERSGSKSRPQKKRTDSR